MNVSFLVNVTDSKQDYIIRISTSTAIIFYACIFVGIIGNAVVFLVYSRINEKQRRDGGKDYRTHIRYYIPILAVFDLVTLIVGAALPVNAINVWLCKGIYFLMFGAVRTSGLILLLIAIQRFMYIALFPKRVLSIRQLRVSLAVVTLFGAVLTLPDLILVNLRQTPYMRYTNKTKLRYHNDTLVKHINNTFVENINETTGKYIDETTGEYISETNVIFINQTVPYLHCAFDYRSSARKAAIIVSLIIILLILFVVSCLYAQILRILLAKLKMPIKLRKPKKNVSQLESSQETGLEIESQKQRNDTNKVYERNDSGASIEFAYIGNQEGQKRQENVDNGIANTEKRNIQRQKAKLKFIVMFFIIVIFYGVSYIPYHIIGLIHEQTAQNLRGALKLFGFVNHIINPFIYGCFDAIFRETCKEIFSNIRCK